MLVGFEGRLPWLPVLSSPEQAAVSAPQGETSCVSAAGLAGLVGVGWGEGGEQLCKVR